MGWGLEPHPPPAYPPFPRSNDPARKRGRPKLRACVWTIGRKLNEEIRYDFHCRRSTQSTESWLPSSTWEMSRCGLPKRHSRLLAVSSPTPRKFPRVSNTIRFISGVHEITGRSVKALFVRPSLRVGQVRFVCSLWWADRLPAERDSRDANGGICRLGQTRRNALHCRHSDSEGTKLLIYEYTAIRGRDSTKNRRYIRCVPDKTNRIRCGRVRGMCGSLDQVINSAQD